ncbi:MAG: lysophospholipid acyltransferase family protein [Syntrophotaleaceae bacterium]
MSASNFDILALFAGVPGQFRWMAKIELFRIPLFGLAMRRAGAIAVDRSNRRNSVLSMRQAVQRIADGTSVVIFPEGLVPRTDPAGVQDRQFHPGAAGPGAGGASGHMRQRRGDAQAQPLDSRRSHLP